MHADIAVMTPCPQGSDAAAAFEVSYEREFGFTLDRPVHVDDLR